LIITITPFGNLSIHHEEVRIVLDEEEDMIDSVKKSVMKKIFLELVLPLVWKDSHFLFMKNEYFSEIKTK
jgi:hypothetical protein